MKRSGIHFLVNWLYACAGGREKKEFSDHFPPRNKQFKKGFYDPQVGIAFFNNCGHHFSRKFDLGPITKQDFLHASSQFTTTIFGLEDALISANKHKTVNSHTHTDILLLRDPLNHLASRVKASERTPETVPTNIEFIELYNSYCEEVMSLTKHLPDKIIVIYDKFVIDFKYRNHIATKLGLTNTEKTREISDFGGGSSFSGLNQLNITNVLTRYKQQKMPNDLLKAMLEFDCISKLTERIFKYDLKRRVNKLSSNN